MIKNYIESGLSLHQIVKKTNKSLTTVRYWVSKHGLKSKFQSFSNTKKEYGKFRTCPRCKKDVPTKDFYSRRGKPHASVYCKSCTNKQVVERQRAFKQKCVEYKGGKCENCGYSKCVGALEFHHLDQKEKDFSISHVKSYTFDDVIKKELDKCILLCANCHREEHEKLALRGIEPLTSA